MPVLPERDWEELRRILEAKSNLDMETVKVVPKAIGEGEVEFGIGVAIDPPKLGNSSRPMKMVKGNVAKFMVEGSPKPTSPAKLYSSSRKVIVCTGEVDFDVSDGNNSLLMLIFATRRPMPAKGHGTRSQWQWERIGEMVQSGPRKLLGSRLGTHNNQVEYKWLSAQMSLLTLMCVQNIAVNVWALTLPTSSYMLTVCGPTKNYGA